MYIGNVGRAYGAHKIGRLGPRPDRVDGWNNEIGKTAQRNKKQQKCSRPQRHFVNINGMKTANYLLAKLMQSYEYIRGINHPDNEIGEIDQRQRTEAIQSTPLSFVNTY